MFSPDVGSLRLPGVALNVPALQLMTVALWRRGIAAVYFALLMGSSFLFLFYSRVAWEVDALQNVLLAAIFLAVTQLMHAGRSSPFPVLLFLLSFSIGCWNHAIFGTAALAFAAAANLIALKWPREDTARLALIGNLNLLLQAILLARYVVVDGPFAATRELVAGFWLWEVKDMDEAVAWVKRCPNPMPGPSEIEIRPVYGMEDFVEVMTPKVTEIFDRTRDKLAGN